MKCSRASRLLALYVEGDLQDSQCGPLDDHLRECGDCRNLAAELIESQALVKSLRSDAVPEAALSSVRRQVLPGIARIDNSHNWALRVERALMSRFRPRYAMTVIAAILVVSGVFASGIVWRTGSESIPFAEVVQPAARGDTRLRSMSTDGCPIPNRPRPSSKRPFNRVPWWNLQAWTRNSRLQRPHFSNPGSYP